MWRILRGSLDAAVEPVKGPLAKLVGGVLGAVSIDVSGTVGRKSCLVLAPHPDDETLGCAVSIMRRIEAGSPVHVAVATDGGQWPPGRDPGINEVTRRAELAEAVSVLGLAPSAVVHFGFADSGLALVEEDLTDAILDLVRRLRPDEVLATDVHDPAGDHAVLGMAARRALSGTGVRLLAYPIHQWRRPGALLRTVKGSGRAEAVHTRTFLDRKRAAINTFHSQLAATTDTGDDADHVNAGLTASFLANFTGARELFFPILGAGRRDPR